MLADLALRHASVEALEQAFEADLRKGRAFVVGAEGHTEREPCRLVVVHPRTQAELALPAEIVWVKRDEPGAGVGVELRDFGPDAREALRAFITSGAAANAEPADEPRDPVPRNVHERVRALSPREREQMARMGTLPERVALERCYGGSVWEVLLMNPQLTPPEVARIAKNGTISRPLIQIILGNAGWLAVPEIQRALLGNPRVAGPQLDRVLRAMPRAEVERLAAGSVYRQEVRTAARRLIG